MWKIHTIEIIIDLQLLVFYQNQVEKNLVHDLKYDDDSIELTIDKITIDTFLSGDYHLLYVTIMTKKIQKVFKEDRTYIIISMVFLMIEWFI